jgi:1-acyl-sn-glycerol-3-phosphate acyltransferase
MKTIAFVRMTLRALLLVPVLCVGLVLALTVLRVAPYTLQRSLIRHWSRALLAVLGIRVDLRPGEAAEHRGLIVANHVSWIDAFVLGSLCGAKFVVRADVARWPILGRMIQATGALFVDRSSPRSLQRSCDELARRLAAGEQFAVFPEGTTSDGRELLPFRANFFEAALQSARPVTVVALRYLDRHGRPDTTPNYSGDTSFAESLVNVLRAPGAITAAATVTAVLRDFDCRKQLASTAEHTIRHSMARAPA